jgi:hypothetical protein
MDGTENEKAVEELEWLIDNADEAELVKHPGDHLCRHKRKGEEIGVRGRILDAMDADRITVKQALGLLRRCRQRLGFDGEGVSRVMEDGSLAPIGGG